MVPVKCWDAFLCLSGLFDVVFINNVDVFKVFWNSAIFSDMS